MPGASNKITNKERAAIVMYVCGFIDDWHEIYIIAEDKSRKETESLKYLDTQISKWKCSAKVKNLIDEYKRIFDDKAADQRNKARQDERNKINEERENQTNEDGENECIEQDEMTTRRKAIDYSDPENRKRLYNEVIRKAKDDPKTQLDAAKMFEQIQKDDKQAAREQKQVRAYLPITCKECALYERAKLKLLSNKNKITKTETAETRPGKLTGGGVEWR